MEKPKPENYNSDKQYQEALKNWETYKSWT